MVAGLVPEAGIERARVVAVIALLVGGQEQVGSGYLVGGRLVVTARHCTRDKATDAAAVGIRVIRASDGATAKIADPVADVIAAPSLDVAAIHLVDAPWPTGGLPGPEYVRVDRAHSGTLVDCVAIGYPLFQRDPTHRTRHTAELHGTIYQTDEVEAGRLLLREPLLNSVAEPPDYTAAGTGTAWSGLSGSVVFHAGFALGVIVEHHPRQGSAAVQLLGFDTIRDQAATDDAARLVADTLGLPPTGGMRLASARTVPPLAGLVDVLDERSGDLPCVRELDPYRLGTTPSVYGDQDSYGADDPYVLRTRHQVDARLHAALQPGRMVLVVGASKVGKTRSAFEAMRRGWADALLAAPTPSSLANLPTHPRLQSTSDALVVWLDDLDRFLTTAEPLAFALLTALHARPGPTLVVATMRREARDRLRATTGEFTRDTRVLLDTATTIELGSMVDDPDEQAAARIAYPNERSDRSGLAERLGYAPQLLELYDDSARSAPLLYVVIRTAIDWRRIGLTRPIPDPDLGDICSEMLWNEHPELDITPEEISAAIQRARIPLPGSKDAAPLHTVALPGRVRAYHPYEYLVAADDGQTGRPRPIDDFYWYYVLHQVDPEDAFAIGVAAYTRNNIPVSVRASTQAAEAGHPGAAFNMGFLLEVLSEPRDLVAARAWYEQAAEAGLPAAMVSLGVLLATHPLFIWGESALDSPDLTGARSWYERGLTPNE
jgi:hypothetical protein